MEKKNNWSKKNITLILSALLTSCGGGGGSASSSNNGNNIVSPNYGKNTEERNIFPSSTINENNHTNSTKELENSANNASFYSANETISTLSSSSPYVSLPNTLSIDSSSSISTINQVGLSPSNPKGNYLGIEEEQRLPLYHSNEHKIYHVGILDTFFYQSEKFKKANNLSRLVDITQNGTDEEDKRHHGTLVTHVFVKKNKLSDIYAQSIMRAKSRTFDTGEEIYHLAHTEPNIEHYQNLYNKGVRIFNNSYGSTWTKNSVEDIYLEKLEKYAETDSIFVWSAGNEKKEQASLESHYAHKKPNIKNGWISAIALEEDTPQSGKTLAAYSNKAGEAVKNWGISAQGNWQIELPKNECQITTTNGCYRYIKGTSFATPTVSATVANVWNQFPWMDNHLVVVTVLSTANKPYEREQTEGPDATFGWGILDNERAIRGPGRFDTRLLTNKDSENLLTVNLRNMHYLNENKLTWTNNIAGDAGIRKKGNGTLYFTGENTYLGDTVIEEGAIQISKHLTKSKVKIKPHGKFIAKNNNSTVILGNNEKNSTYELDNNGGILGVYGNGLKINGNYKGKNNARIMIDIDRAKLDISGNLDMGNTGYIIADVDNFSLVSSQHSKERVILTANQIENYRGEYKTSNELSKYIDIEKFYATNKEIKVKYKRNSTEYVYKKIDYTPTVSEENAGKMLDIHLDELSLRENNRLSNSTLSSITKIMSADDIELPKIIKSLSGEIYASSQNILMKQNKLFNHTLSSRLASLMNAEKNSVWFDSLYTKYNLHQKGYSKGDVTTTGIQIGIDGKLNKNLTLGGTFLNGKSSAQFGERVGNIESKSNGLSLYGYYDFNQYYLSGRLGFSRINSNIKRDIIDQYVALSYQSKIYNIYTELGKIWYIDNMSINPFLAVELNKIYRGGFKENVDFGIHSDKISYNQRHFLVGMRGTIKLDSISLIANISHSFEPETQHFDFNANFKDSERKITIKGIKQPKHSTFVEFGISYMLSRNFTLQSKYSLTMEGTKKENNIFNLSAVYSF
ncbi:autotransporter domain-containing protein [[Haemophilus] felis]|nr:autotransporter domain-containing protein [[Haemophilus] felis]